MAHEQRVQRVGILCCHQRHQLFIAQARRWRPTVERILVPSVQLEPLKSLRPESFEFSRQRNSSDGFSVAGQGEILVNQANYTPCNERFARGLSALALSR